jgi:hypothetical protein
MNRWFNVDFNVSERCQALKGYFAFGTSRLLLLPFELQLSRIIRDIVLMKDDRMFRRIQCFIATLVIKYSFFCF